MAQLGDETVRVQLQACLSPQKDQALLNLLSRDTSGRRQRALIGNAKIRREKDLMRRVMEANPSLTEEEPLWQTGLCLSVELQ